MPTQQINNISNSQSYLNRDYASIRQDLIVLLQTYYPEQWMDFSAASAGMSLVDLLAYVSDLLSYYTDKKFNELFIDGVTEIVSAFRLAKTLGYKPKGVNPAITLCDFTIQVPPTANGPDPNYLPIYQMGVQVQGSGQVFETISECDFSSDFSTTGVANRLIEPVFNSNQDILRYLITKREVVEAGTTVVYKREISPMDASTPFLEITLPNNNVLEIVNVIVKPGVGIVQPPTFAEFNDPALQYFEVEQLMEDQVFLTNDQVPSVNGVRTGQYTTVPQRFMKEFMADGSCKLIFGGGTPNYSAYAAYVRNVSIIDNTDLINLNNVFNNDSLGVMLPPNSTLYVKYRIGGGILSNVASNTLNQVANINANFPGSDPNIIQTVTNSTTANNPLPALGGGNLQTVNEIKYNIANNFAAQDRCVTLDDYISRAYQIPGAYGTPFRIYGTVDQNKVILYILSLNADGTLNSSSTSIIKNNIADYLANFRMVNDYVEIDDGVVFNLQVEVDAFINKNFNASEVKTEIINGITKFFDIDNWQFNQNIYISQITDIVGEIPGVINVVDIRLYNITGGIYSTSLCAQATGPVENFKNGTSRTQIEFITNTVFGNTIAMYEVKSPTVDVFVRTS